MTEEQLKSLLDRTIEPAEDGDIWPLVSKKIRRERSSLWEYPVAVAAGLLTVFVLKLTVGRGAIETPAAVPALSIMAEAADQPIFPKAN